MPVPIYQPVVKPSMLMPVKIVKADCAVMVAVAGVLSLLLRAGDSAKKISSPTKKHEARPGPARSPDRSGVARASARGPRGSDPD